MEFSAKNALLCKYDCEPSEGLFRSFENNGSSSAESTSSPQGVSQSHYTVLLWLTDSQDIEWNT